MRSTQLTPQAVVHFVTQLAKAHCYCNSVLPLRRASTLKQSNLYLRMEQSNFFPSRSGCCRVGAPYNSPLHPFMCSASANGKRRRAVWFVSSPAYRCFLNPGVHFWGHPSKRTAPFVGCCIVDLYFKKNKYGTHAVWTPVQQLISIFESQGRAEL